MAWHCQGVTPPDLALWEALTSFVAVTSSPPVKTPSFWISSVASFVFRCRQSVIGCEIFAAGRRTNQEQKHQTTSALTTSLQVKGVE